MPRPSQIVNWNGVQYSLVVGGTYIVVGGTYIGGLGTGAGNGSGSGSWVCVCFGVPHFPHRMASSDQLVEQRHLLHTHAFADSMNAMHASIKTKRIENFIVFFFLVLQTILSKVMATLGAFRQMPVRQLIQRVAIWAILQIPFQFVLRTKLYHDAAHLLLDIISILT